MFVCAVYSVLSSGSIVVPLELLFLMEVEVKCERVSVHCLFGLASVCLFVYGS